MDKPFENGCGHRKKVTIIFAILFVLTVIFVNSCKTPENNVSRARQTSAYAVIDLRSGKIIKSSNGEAKLPIASTTKILSAITVIEEVFDLDEEIFVPSAAVGIEGSSVYLSPGERISYRDLLYGLMLRSGNDCAVALAIKTSGSVEKFVAKMNEVAKKAGAINSSFANPHGLDDEKHYSTADDLAKITAYAMNNDVFRTIVSTKYHDTSGEVSRCFKNKNKMLWNYDGAIGVKTGYTKKSGRCLVSAAEKYGKSFAVVVGTKAFAPYFLTLKTLKILFLGVFAFSMGTASGVLFGKLMCKLSKGKINPLIGAAGVSAVPMAARVVQDVGRQYDPENYLLMHAMGPNVAGVIGSAIAAGVLLAIL